VLHDNTDEGSGLHRLEEAPRRTVLYEWHSKLADKSHIVPFAGYLMPLWYSSIAGEHNAVREAVGIFDCTHMGLLEISGVGAAEFIDQLATNSATSLEAGHAQYSFILDASGEILDDVIVYRKDRDEFFVVVNAANDAKIKKWLSSLLEDEICIDPADTDRRVSARPHVRDLRGCDCGDDCRVDVALQGPRSLDVLSALIRDEGSRLQAAGLRPFEFMETELEGIECLMSRTGYTGARCGFELFVHPEKAPRLWEAILRTGKPLGVLPCGLGSRDSLRIEAGLPLYGHELAGEFHISPFEAGYGWAVKLEKDFFIGKTAMERRAREYDMKVARIELPGTKGIRPVRQNDGVLDKCGQCAGWVLSCAGTGEKQIALVYVDKEAVQEDDAIGLYYAARSNSQVRRGRKQRINKGERLEPDLAGKVLDRFAKF
jgi:glycine hydroxymethyltransferase